MKVEIPVENKHQLITLPVVKGVATTILNGLGTSAFTEILMQSEISGVKTQQDKSDVTMQGNRVLSVTFEEHATRDAQAIGMSSQILTPPIVNDPLLGLSISAVHASSRLVISLKGSSSSRNEVKHIWDSYFSRINQNQETIVHDVKYRYELPLELIDLLAHIHGLRESRAGYGDDLREYITSHSSMSLSFSSNASGTVGGIAIDECQTRIPSALKPVVHEKDNFEKDRETGMYEYTVEATIIINMPIMFRVSYPVMVHQQLLNATYIPPAYTDQYNIEVPHTIYGFMTNFERPRLLSRILADSIIRIPKEDQFKPGFADQPDLACLATILVSVDASDPSLIMSLRDLGDFMIDPEIHAFIMAYPNEVLVFQESIIKINLYSGNERLHDESMVIVDGNLRLRTGELNERVTYRVGLHVMNGLMLLSSRGWAAILDNPKILVAIVGYINPSYLDSEIMIKIYNSKKLSSVHRQWIQSNRRHFMRGIPTSLGNHYSDALQPQISPT